MYDDSFLFKKQMLRYHAGKASILDFQSLQLLQKGCLGSDLLELRQLKRLSCSLLLLELVDLLQLFRHVADLLLSLCHLTAGRGRSRWQEGSVLGLALAVVVVVVAAV